MKVAAERLFVGAEHRFVGAAIAALWQPNYRLAMSETRLSEPALLVNPLTVALLVFGSVAVVGLVVALAMVAMRPTVNVASHGSSIDNSPSAQVEVR